MESPVTLVAGKNPGAGLAYLSNRLSANGVDVETCTPEGDWGLPLGIF